MVYVDLIHNLALLVALSIVSGFIEKRWPRHSRVGIGLQGLLFGGAAVLGMLRPLNLGPGLIFDGRSIMVSLCALFFGPWAAAMASVLPMAYRFWLGGAGTLTGLLVILSSVVVGLLARHRLDPETRPLSVQDLYLFGLVVHLAMIALMFTLPEGAVMAVIRRIGPPVLLLYPLATILAGKILSDQVTAGQQLAALRESEMRYRLLVENANEMILVAQEGRIAFANRKTIDFLGYDPEELEGVLFIDHIHPEDRALVADRHQKRLKGEPLPEVYPFRIVDREGKTRWVEINAVRTDWLGSPATLNFLSDISERRQLEEELRQREIYLSKIFDLLPIGLWFADKHGKLIRGNPAGVKIWGAEPKVSLEEYGVFKARRRPSGEEIRPEDWALAHTIKEGVTISDELLEIDAFDGRKKIVLNYTAPVLGDTGQVLGAIVMNVDVTESKRAEAEREKLWAQLIQARKMESVGRLAGGVAHDFNNMLSVIIGNAEIALESVSRNDPLEDALTEILSAARRSSEITGQLLAFARKQTIHPVMIDLNDAVEGMLKMLRRLIGEDIDLAWKPGSGLWPVLMDPAQIHQILANLLANARDAIAGVGNITLETDNVRIDAAGCAGLPGFVPGEYVMLMVRDNGSGMEKEALDNLFEPFFTTKPVGEGTGLGLATVYGIVKQNNGFIYVDSEPGRGTTFRVYMPRHTGPAEAVPNRASAPVIRGGNETILVVEDEAAVLKLARRMLSSLGYTVLVAAGPLAALELAKRHTGAVDLLITDVVMPEMNGRDLAKKLRAIYPGLKVLYMSGYTAEVISRRGVLEDGVQFIQKPFNKGDLARKVREALLE